MTNHELGNEEWRPAYCPECGSDFQVAAGEEDEIKIICSCSSHDPEEFVEDLASQLPLPSSDPDKINKKNSDRDDQDGRGFQ